MAAALAGSGDNVSAAIYYQRVYYGYPLSAEAGLASTEIEKLQTDLGEKYPPALPTAMLGRAIKLLDAGQAVRARKELEALVPQLGGAERDLARVRIGVAHYTAEENAVAYKYLSDARGRLPRSGRRAPVLPHAERAPPEQPRLRWTRWPPSSAVCIPTRRGGCRPSWRRRIAT